MKNEVPRYMNEGSEGPHVTVLQAFLKAITLLGPDGTGLLGRDIVFDMQYGRVTSDALAVLQAHHDLEADGHCGPDTRQLMKDAYNFDIEEAWLTVPGVTKFVQPDGSVIEWGPTAEEVVS